MCAYSDAYTYEQGRESFPNSSSHSDTIIFSNENGRIPIPHIPRHIDTTLTLGSYIQQHVSDIAKVDYIKQQKERNSFQRQGYTEILFGVASEDGLTVLLNYVKVELNLSTAIRAKLFVAARIVLSGGVVVSYYLPERLDYPADPWKKEWWFYR
ncbi:MAG: hypothetical protein ACHQQQ_07445 [Bacteroidota bacterium]